MGMAVVMSRRITLTNPADMAFSERAQWALCNQTVLPSGFKTPAADMVIVGYELVPMDRAEWQRKVEELERHER